MDSLDKLFRRENRTKRGFLSSRFIHRPSLAKLHSPPCLSAEASAQADHFPASTRINTRQVPSFPSPAESNEPRYFTPPVATVTEVTILFLK